MGKTLRLRTSVDLSVTMATSVVLKSCYNHSSLSSSMLQDEREIHRSFKAYTIPRKERRPSEDCQFTLPVDSREAKEIEHAVRRLTWDTNDLDRAVSISHIKKVDNPNLEREYHEKRATLREEGRSPKELTQQLAFCVETDDGRVKEICRLGLECEGDNHTLGDGGMGVTVWKCPDLCLRALTWPASGMAYLVVFKIVKGRVKSVTPKLSPETPNLEPTPNYDCHVTRNPASTSVTDLSTLMRSTQYYLYEYDDEGLPSKRPRHCLPFAVILLKKQKCTASPMKPPLAIPLEKPTSPVKECTKISEGMKTPSFSDEDGILAWRGLVTSKEKSLGHVSLLAGHKLGFNFWKSYLDVSRKIPLNQLSSMLPGDIKSAWKSPLLYRNNVLSLGTVKPTPRQPSEKFTSFTRYLSGKAKSAGVLCVDSFTTLFLVPSSKLAVHLGFCTAEKPPRMFCILCRRQSTPLSPPFIWPLASPVTPPADCRSGPFSNTTTTAGAFMQSASLDLKARHKAKIMVTSAENKLRLSPKHPRQIAKRSLSFPLAPAVDASKRLPKLSRSASTSGSGSFHEDSMMKPMILSRPNVDNAVRRSSTESLGDDPRAIKVDSSQIQTNLNGNSLLCLNSVSSREKQQDGQSCIGFNGDHAKNTPNRNGVSANTSTSITPELDTTHISHLPSSKTCPNLLVKPNCGNSESETKLPTLDNPFKLQVNHSRNVLEFQPYFNPRSLSEPSFSKYDVQKTHPTTGEGPITPSAMEDPGRERSCTDEHTHSRKRDLSSTNSFPAHRVLERARAAIKDSSSSSTAIGTLSSPTSRAFSPYWPDSPIVFSASDRIPFFTPVKTDGPDEEERTLSVKSDDNWCVNPSQPGNELLGNTTTNLTTKMDEAHSTPRDLVKDPCGSLEEKTSQSKSLYLENWNKTSSFFNNKQALRSLRKAVAHQKSPKLNKSTKSSDNLQTIDMDISEPSDIESSDLSNAEKVDTLSKGATRPRIPQLHDDMQTVDMEISEFPECPIIVSHASSCAPSVPLNNSSFTPVAVYINEHARDPPASSSHSTVISIDMEISEPSDIESSDLSNAEKVDTWSKSTTPPRISQLHDDMQTVDMEISEFPECPIIVSHASSCAPSVPLSNSSFTPVADYINGHARDTAASPSISTVTKIAEPLSIYSDVRNGCNQSAGSVGVKITQQTELNTGNSSEHYDTRVGRKQPAVNITTANVGLETLQSGDSVEPVDMDISDGMELLSNNVALDSDTISSARTEMTEELHSCMTANSENPLVPIEVTSVSNKNENSLAVGSNTSKQAVSEIRYVNTPGVAEETKPGATTDEVEAKLTSEKQCMVSSLGHDNGNHVTKDSEQEQVQNVLSKTSDASTEKICSPTKNSPPPCLLTERKAVGFSLSPQKSSKLCSRQLKTLQDAFTSATNCDESCMRVSDFKLSAKLSPTKPCKSSPRSSSESDSKTQDFDVQQSFKCDDNIDRSHSDSDVIKDESHDCKPLAVNCTSVERDVKYFPEHTDPQLGGVVETSLFQDWGLLSVDTDSSKFRSRKEDYSFAVEELEECTEVVDFGSETDLALKPIETWPLIMDCDHPEPETVFCSPINSIETFTFRFPGKCELNEDADEVSPTNTMSTEEETILVEERYRGVCVEPEIVNCSDANSASGDILPRIDPPDKNDEEQNSNEHLKTSQSPCEISQMSHKVALVKPVSRTPVAKTHFDELLNKRGSVCEDSSSFKGSNSVEKEFQRTDNSTDRCSESPAPQNLKTSENESVTHTKLPEIPQSLESTKEDVTTPIVHKQDITCFTETLNTAPTASVKPSVSVTLPTSASPLSVDHRKETTTTEKCQDVPAEFNVICPVNSTVGRAKAVDCPAKLPSATEMNKNKKQCEKVAEKVKEVIVSPSQSSVDEQEKRGNGTSTENLQKVNCTQQMLRGTADPKQQKPISIRIKAMTLTNGWTAEKLNSKSSKDNKQFAVSANKDVKQKELSSGTPTQNRKKRHFTEAKSVKRDSYAVKYTFVKHLEPRAKTAKHDTLVEETPKTVKPVSFTASQPRLSKKPESYPQVDKTKDGHSSTGPGVSSPGLSKKPESYSQADKTKETHSGMGPGVSSPGLSKKAESYPKADKTKETHSSTGSGVSSQGRSEPLGDMNDLQRDNRVPALKRKHTPEPENIAKQAKMDSVPVLVNAAGGVKNDHVPSEIKSNFVNNRNVYQPYKEKRQFEYNQAAYQRDSEAARLKQNHQQYQYPCWMAPPFPAQLPVRNGEWGGGGLPNPVPNHTQWYKPRGVPNQNQFQQVYTGLPQCRRPTFVPNMCKVRPMFEPTPAMPGPYVFPGNAYQVPYPMLGPR